MTERERWAEYLSSLDGHVASGALAAEQVRAMRSFAEKLSPVAPLPVSGWTDGGELYCHWAGGPLCADIRFLRDGRVDVFMKRGDEVSGHEGDDGGELGDEIVATLLRRVNRGEATKPPNRTRVGCDGELESYWFPDRTGPAWFSISQWPDGEAVASYRDGGHLGEVLEIDPADISPVVSALLSFLARRMTP